MPIIGPRETHDYRNYNLLGSGTNASKKRPPPKKNTQPVSYISVGSTFLSGSPQKRTAKDRSPPKSAPDALRSSRTAAEDTRQPPLIWVEANCWNEGAVGLLPHHAVKGVHDPGYFPKPANFICLKRRWTGRGSSLQQPPTSTGLGCVVGTRTPFRRTYLMSGMGLGHGCLQLSLPKACLMILHAISRFCMCGKGIGSVRAPK